jgi:signal transduction histidine kinase
MHAEAEHVEQTAELAMTLAHELSQPVAAIANYALGGLERARRGRASMADLLYALEQIAPEAEHATEIIRTMRDFARKRAARLVLTSVEELINEALRLAQPDVQRHAARVVVELEPDLPCLPIDRTQIEQVLLNLMRNGLEAMTQTPPAQRVLVIRAAQRGHTGVEFAVQDFGCGIEPAQVPRLFKSFYTTKPQGVGLGLWISRTIIHVHGGRLWVESEPGPGAVFRFLLSMQEADEDG